MPTSADREALRAVARLARLLERATGELSLAHYRVLSAVAAGDQRASRLAERLALGRSAVSAAVDSLTGRGLLARSAVAGDLRGSALELTAAGRELLERAEAAAAAELAAVVARTAEPGPVLAALAALGPALDGIAAERHTGKHPRRPA
ncbi:MarR family transcriptional regulator [Dactylosporangium sp. NPDC051541]|uniref:MarR family transcriptional regulator n=1 Tax=Dactylosporangium sp. NPDC051541 TaxID=3363977 RepID=UPI0037890110